MTGLVLAVLGLLAAALLVLSRWLRSEGGLPNGGVFYEDSGPDSPVLYSATHNLAGKPDYLLSTEDGIVPVEIKPTRRGDRVYRSDLLQLAAYCLLVEDTRDDFAGYGLLRAGKLTRRVPFTSELRSELLATLDLMRHISVASDVAPNHGSPARCRACASRDTCGRPVLKAVDPE